MESGERTLMVTRPTRLIALRFYAAMVFAFILAGVLFFQAINWFVPSTSVTFPLKLVSGSNTLMIIP